MLRLSMDSATYLARLQRVLSLLDTQQLDNAIQVVAAAWEQGRQIITLGNGGEFWHETRTAEFACGQWRSDS